MVGLEGSGQPLQLSLRQGGITGRYGAPGFLGHGLGENPMSKEVGDMVQSKRVAGSCVGADGGSPEGDWSRRRRRGGWGPGPWRPGSGGAQAGNGTWFCGCCAASRWTRSSRAVGVELYRLEAWQARALAGLELGLKAQAGEPLAAELNAAKRHIGELSMEIELLRERARAAERRLPLATRRSRR